MIIMYTKTGCPWCNEARTFLKEKRVDFEEREVLGNEDYRKELVAKSGQGKTPTLEVDGEILADMDKEAIGKFLRERGVIR
ncbi:MAG: glutaredoxin domain-containing protein [bacterium]|nr:glutaredoxin domain-containing protein [bacterium]